MATIHSGQGAWYLDIETEDADLPTATNPKIWYEKPSTERDFFVATIVGTKLRYIFEDVDIDEVRGWKWQGTYMFGDRTAKTPIRKIDIQPALDV